MDSYLGRDTERESLGRVHNTELNANHYHVHGDYHSIRYDAGGHAHAVSDGGYFHSGDDGLTWTNDTNTFGVANEVSVDVSPSGIYAAAWDVGAHYSLGGGNWQGDDAVSGSDSQQIVANPNNADFYFEHAQSIERWANHNGVWNNVSNGLNNQGHPQMAVNSNTDVFAISTDQTGYSAVYSSSTWGALWTPVGNQVFTDAPTFLNVTTESSQNVYLSGFTGSNAVFVGGPTFTAATSPPSWPAGSSVCGAAIERLYYTVGPTDYYVLGASDPSPPCQSPGGSGRQSGSVYRTSDHGATWTQLTGSASAGIPQSEVVNNALGIDTATGSVVLGTQGLGSSCPSPGGPCGAGIYKLNDPDVDNANIHWRRWIAGLPNPAQIVEGVAGQYETDANGEPIFFYYAAVYGRGIWKREARGGEP